MIVVHYLFCIRIVMVGHITLHDYSSDSPALSEEDICRVSAGSHTHLRLDEDTIIDPDKKH